MILPRFGGIEEFRLEQIERPAPGTFAGYVCLRADQVAAPPQSLPLVEAGAVPLAAMTAWQGLTTQGGLQPGQRVLIQGGSGEVGHFAVQLGHQLGATVYAAASGQNTKFLGGLETEQHTGSGGLVLAAGQPNLAQAQIEQGGT